MGWQNCGPAKAGIDYEPWTNAGRFHMEFDYSYHGTMRSFEDSLQRMNLESMDKVKKIETICAGYEVPLLAAALEFVVAHPAIPSFIAGTRTVEQLQKNLEWFSQPIPTEFGATLKSQGLLREDAPTP